MAQKISSTGGIYVQKDGKSNNCGYPNGIFEYEDSTAYGNIEVGNPYLTTDLPMVL